MRAYVSDAPDSLLVPLPDEAATLRLGAQLADLLRESGAPRLVLLFGPLGAGKTCLVRGLVAALPGGDLAEVASPTFSLCNCYPTSPPVAHVDLYRNGHVGQIGQFEEILPADSRLALSDELLDLIDADEDLVIIEWAEFFPDDCLPASWVELTWEERAGKRFVRVARHGTRLPLSIFES